MAQSIAQPQPDQIPEREREDAMGAYLMMFAAVAVGLPLPVINLIAALIYYFVNRRRSRFVHFHSLQSLLAQLPTTFLNWGLLYWCMQIWWFGGSWLNGLFWCYVSLVLVANLCYFVFSIVAAVRARQGRVYVFFLFGNIALSVAFSPRSTFKYDNEPAA